MAATWFERAMFRDYLLWRQEHHPHSTSAARKRSPRAGNRSLLHFTFWILQVRVTKKTGQASFCSNSGCASWKSLASAEGDRLRQLIAEKKSITVISAKLKRSSEAVRMRMFKLRNFG
jgi:hypothetical protein